MVCRRHLAKHAGLSLAALPDNVIRRAVTVWRTTSRLLQNSWRVLGSRKTKPLQLPSCFDSHLRTTWTLYWRQRSDALEFCSSLLNDRARFGSGTVKRLGNSAFSIGGGFAARGIAARR